MTWLEAKDEGSGRRCNWVGIMNLSWNHMNELENQNGDVRRLVADYVPRRTQVIGRRLIVLNDDMGGKWRDNRVRTVAEQYLGFYSMEQNFPNLPQWHCCSLVEGSYAWFKTFFFSSNQQLEAWFLEWKVTLLGVILQLWSFVFFSSKNYFLKVLVDPITTDFYF